MTDDVLDGPETGDVVEEEAVSSGDAFIDGLLEGWDSVRYQPSHGQDVLIVPADDLAVVAEKLRETGFEMCVDVTAVDWYKTRVPRYDVVVSLVSLRHRRRLRLLVPVSHEDPTVPSVVPVWPGANFAEREVYDMFGIRFEGHPDLARILMPDDWEGHPLRKDYGVGAVPVQFKGAHRVT